MKVATKNDAKEWFQPPPDVVQVQVCRVSGLLPVAGCWNAASIGADGQVAYKSMVYTEYFARGTEPTKTCNIHSAPAYQPYPEPVIATIGFDNNALGVEPVEAGPPPPLAAPPMGSPSSLPDLPSAPPPAPPPSAPPPSQSPATLPALPSAAPEPPPAPSA